MAIVKISPMKLPPPPWLEGFVLDYHTISSTPTGDPYYRFDTERTPLGELLFQLKYRSGGNAVVVDIVETAQYFVGGWRPAIDCIVPAPPSLARRTQPVVQVAQELAARLHITICEGAVIKTKPTPQMKNLDDWSERQRALAEAIQAGATDVKGRSILLFDDLIESGFDAQAGSRSASPFGRSRHLRARAHSNEMRSMIGMSTVFIAGSRRLSRLNKDVKSRLDNIVAKGLRVIVGDANGVDKSVQEYLLIRQYRNVTVYCMEGVCRNNLGHWPMQRIGAADPTRGDFAYYSTKDRAMADEADYGLMLWDGHSRGTLVSIVNLVRQGKVVVVYVASDKSFHTLHSQAHLAACLGRIDPDALRRIERDLQTVATGGAQRNKADAASLF